MMSRQARLQPWKNIEDIRGTSELIASSVLWVSGENIQMCVNEQTAFFRARNTGYQLVSDGNDGNTAVFFFYQ